MAKTVDEKIASAKEKLAGVGEITAENLIAARKAKKVVKRAQRVKRALKVADAKRGDVEKRRADNIAKAAEKADKKKAAEEASLNAAAEKAAEAAAAVADTPAE
jgi:hypothetical protein